MTNQDDFYVIEKATPSRVKKILRWADKNALRTDVTMLQACKSFARTGSDKGFDEVVNLIDKSASEFFRVALRKDWNAFLILSDKKDIRDLLGVFVRGIDVDMGTTKAKEYFIEIFMNPDKLDEIKKMCRLRKL